ncbi:hypothetical protein N7540_013199 [Penicillium herquei]|nr:hypothetical protein N7540_013199 [Penicillium herquei]
MPPPEGFKQIHDLLPNLSLLGQIFKFDSDDGESMFLGEVLDTTTADSCLKKISQDRRLCQNIYIGLDEGAKIYMVAEEEAGENRYYEIEFESIKVPPSTEIICEWQDGFGWVPVDGLDEGYKEQGGWMMNPAVLWKQPPFILIPRLGKKVDSAFFVQATSEVSLGDH